MNTYQQPLDGVYGKDWKISSKMGWRIHPIHKTKKHHNGTDIISLRSGTTYVEAFANGRVVKARQSNAAGGGFGYYVVLRHYLDGEYYTSLYAHLEPNSFQVKVGQLLSAGDVLGKMGTSGMSTGKHLHFEIWKGKKHGWSSDGKGFVEPVGFIKALNASAQAKAWAKESTPETDPVEPEPNHEPTKKTAKGPSVEAFVVPVTVPIVVPVPRKVANKPAVKPVAKPVAKKIEKPKTHKIVSGDTLGKIARKYRTNVATLTKLNKIERPDLIFVGQTIKLP